jgi:hypothetical protein
MSEYDDQDEPETVALVAQPAPGMFSPMAIATQSGLDAATKAIENAIEFKARAIKAALTGCPPKSIVKMGPNPFITEALLVTIFTRIGGGTIQAKPTKVERDEDGLGAEVELTITHPLFGSVDAIGYFHESEIDDGAHSSIAARKYIIRQRAKTRAIGNALRQMLGLAQPTWEWLAQFNIKPDDCAGADFKGKGGKGKGGNPLKSRVMAHIEAKHVTWGDITTLMGSLGLGKGKALDLDDAGLTKLADALDAQTKGETA